VPRYLRRIAVLAILAFGAVDGAGRTIWYEIDSDASQIAFVAQSRVTKAHGLFRKWDFKGKISGNFHVVGDLVLECASIDTDNDRRDYHLKGPDFFDCPDFPQHTFRVKSVKPDSGNVQKATRFELEGELTIRGRSKTLAITLLREGNDERTTLTSSTFIDREDFGITYNSALNPIEKNIRIDIRLVLNRRTRG
jgi:polyisoprenoid-binding protein YceI